MAGGVAPINLWEVFNAAANSEQRRMADRAARADRKEQMDFERSRIERQDKLSDEDRAFAKEQFEWQRDQKAGAASAAAAEERAKATAQVKLSLAEQLQKNPAAAGQMQQAVDRMAKSGRIDHFVLPGHRLPEGMAGPTTDPGASDVGRMYGEAVAGGAAFGLKPEKPTDEMGPDVITKRVYFRSNGKLRPGQPGFDVAYGKEQEIERQAQLELANAVGGKMLPTGAVETIADTDVAIGLLDELEGAYEDAVPAEGTAEQIFARLSAHVPNSPVAIYNEKAKLAAQKAGLVLEKGKLQASDFPRYLQMLTPQPGDSPEAARAKIRNAKQALRAAAQGSRKMLGDAGYRVPESSEAAAPKKNVAASVLDVAAEIGSAPDEFRKQLEAEARAGDPQAQAIINSMPKARR